MYKKLAVRTATREFHRLRNGSPPALAQDVERLRQLAAGIAHDFNNLLTAIICGADLAKSKLSPNHPALPALDIASAAGEKAAALTRQLMAFAGISPFLGSGVDLSALVDGMAASFRAMLPAGVGFRLNVAVEPPLVWADAGQVEKLVQALVANAVEAIPEGARGTVSIGVDAPRSVCLPNDVQIGAAPCDGAYVQLTVGDTGCGMTDDLRRRVFEPFFSTKLMGRGLGLAAVAGIVRAHGGAIHVQSAPGAGSVFCVYLPAMATEPGNELPTPWPRF